ncbi:unnamed protein product [Plutella xylostella]|uniref:Elongation of very long chain fatty acids protein n=1 Tax=Plutella xylostella TaxID=51655 RepID=A0A8S4G8Z4_PLUXY|nr:unnamed protein product [Plutella xylostella]
MSVILKGAVRLYYYLNEEIADPRTQDWFLMRTPWPGLAVLLLYLAVVFKWLPAHMSRRPAYDLKTPIAVYNAIQIIGCGYLVYQSMALGWMRHYKMVCQPVDDGPYAVEFAWKVCYGYFAIKMVDLLDTVFFVLRKKQNQVTFLHVYHHFGMVALAWGIVKWVPGGHMTLLIPVNSLVHMVMYGYYLLSVWDDSYKSSLWWKKHVTQIQITQFVVMLVHMMTLALATDCNYPKQPAYIIIPQNLFIVALFLDFYLRAYVLQPKQAKETNGVSKKE